MVFFTSPLWRRITFSVPNSGPDRYWRKRKILMMSAHFRGRKQNCYTMAVQHVRRALRSATWARDLKPKDNRELQDARLSAACEEHGFKYEFLKKNLVESNILLNRKVLCDLAIWEPRTFKCITDLAWTIAKSKPSEKEVDLHDPPEGVILNKDFFK